MTRFSMASVFSISMPTRFAFGCFACPYETRRSDCIQHDAARRGADAEVPIVGGPCELRDGGRMLDQGEGAELLAGMPDDDLPIFAGRCEKGAALLKGEAADVVLVGLKLKRMRAGRPFAGEVPDAGNVAAAGREIAAARVP